MRVQGAGRQRHACGNPTLPVNTVSACARSRHSHPRHSPQAASSNQPPWSAPLPASSSPGHRQRSTEPSCPGRGFPGSVGQSAGSRWLSACGSAVAVSLRLSVAVSLSPCLSVSLSLSLSLPLSVTLPPSVSLVGRARAGHHSPTTHGGLVSGRGHSAPSGPASTLSSRRLPHTIDGGGVWIFVACKMDRRVQNGPRGGWVAWDLCSTYSVDSVCPTRHCCWYCLRSRAATRAPCPGLVLRERGSRHMREPYVNCGCEAEMIRATWPNPSRCQRTRKEVMRAKTTLPGEVRMIGERRGDRSPRLAPPRPDPPSPIQALISVNA